MPNLSGRTPSGAVGAGFVPEIWAQLTIDEAETEFVCWDAIDHSWQSDLVKGDRVNIAVFNHVSASEVVVGTKAASADIATGSKKQLIMNQWFERPIDVDVMTIRQSQVDWASAARKEAAYAIREEVDSSVAAKFATLNSTLSPVVRGSDGVEFSDDLWRELVEILNEKDVPLDNERFLIIDPSGVSDILKYDKFISAQYVNLGRVQNGQVGSTPIYGCNVRVTNNLVAATTGAYGALLHRKAITSALQIETPWTEEYKELHQVRYQHEALWGVLEVRDTFGVCFYTRKS